ncbi:hypothetical protein G6F31_020567 [Rhizopus arrhizus]|nr:hypothetical protein G6F31_020567 [Rhizopus arrhizus]
MTTLLNAMRWPPTIATAARDTARPRPARPSSNTMPPNAPMLHSRADPRDRPGGRTRADPAFAKTQRQAADDDGRQAEPPAAFEGIGQQQENAAGRARHHADHDRLLRPHGVGHAARV